MDSALVTEAIKHLSIPSSDSVDGIQVVASPVVLVDPSTNPVTLGSSRFRLISVDTLGVVRQADVTAMSPPNAFNQGVFGTYNFSAVSVLNTAANNYEQIRTPTKFGFAACTTVAATDVFSPTAGKKFRLLRCIIIPAAGMAAAGVEVINLSEETLGTFLTVQAYLPIAAGIVTQPPIVIDLTPNGYLSTTVTKKFQVTLGTAATAGAVSVTFIGTEE